MIFKFFFICFFYNYGIEIFDGLNVLGLVEYILIHYLILLKNLLLNISNKQTNKKT